MKSPYVTFLDHLLFQLVNLRCLGIDERGLPADWSKWGQIWGSFTLARELDLITHDQWKLCIALVQSASDHIGQPFPNASNAGPVMPAYVAYERRHVQVKQPAQVPSNEHSGPVSAPAPSSELYLCCVRSIDGNPPFPLFATMHPLPPRAPIAGRWSLDGDAFRVMRKTSARRPSPEVLARCLRQRQTNALRATA